ncbi:MAG: DUF424 family protein [Methanomassiliicoccales archaeon]|nr:DUF424 family protein [Methanomassiliicoccales archaeon]
MITLRVYRRRGEVLLAACDKELVGRIMREGDLKLEVCPTFYEGEDADEEMLLNRLRNASIANLVGERTVGIAIKHELVDEGCVVRIEGVPHVQLVRM